MPVIRTLLLFITLAFFCGTNTFAAPLTAQVAEELRGILSQNGPPQIRLDRETPLNADILPVIYQRRGFTPVWLDDFGLTGEARDLLDRLRGAADEGLCPEDYHLDQIEPLVALEGDSLAHGVLFDDRYLARLDLLLTDSFLLLASHLIQGRVDPADIHDGWRARPRQVDLETLLDYALREGRIEEVLSDLSPPHRGYLLLLAKLRCYRQLSVRGGWPIIAAGPSLKPGERDERLPTLRQRLLLSDDLSEIPALAEDELILYDRQTQEAVVNFQERHGLDPDGVLGPKTLAELNVSVEDRIRQLEINIERWRWLPKSLGERHIQVNIADFRLAAVEKGNVVLTMPVVVGTSYRRTPVFSATMTHLYFAPYWNVPSTILREDKLPRIKRDPAFLGRDHYEIVRFDGGETVQVDPLQIDWSRVKASTFPGQLRQKPGAWNALGRVKFMFPNPFDVYLHDTPDKHLFARDARLFSSGCIRVERPRELAVYLLGQQGWSREAVSRAMEQSEQHRVDLASRVPVHVLYWTAWVDEEGTLQFRRDIYDRDLDLDRALRHLPGPKDNGG